MQSRQPVEGRSSLARTSERVLNLTKAFALVVEQLLMATKPTPAELAETLLEILVKEIGLEPGHPVPDQLLKAKFRERGGHSEDIADGLKYAHGQYWLEYDSDKDAFFLTDAGFNAA
jgi:hypothetical protein